jgi:hypothetical protein
MPLNSNLSVEALSSFVLRGTSLDSLSNNLDPETPYNLNSLGLRGPEPDGKADLVALGCSQTFGQGVFEEDTWPNRLAVSLGATYVNLAVPSESPYGMLNQALAYIKKYGRPKTIVALFPGYNRMLAPINYSYNRENENVTPRSVDESELVNLNFNSENNKIPTVAKKPYPLENILSLEVPMYQSLQAVRHMVAYCDLMGIELVFSSWDRDMKNAMVELDYKQYVEVPDYGSGLECHAEEKQLNESRWHEGSDAAKHMGAHAHIHYAEAFAKNIRSING